jgi:hypothetical protein
MSKGLVYFATHDNDSWRATYPVIKIGSTTNLPKRLMTLSIGSPVRLIAAGTIVSSDAYNLEKSFHRAFSRENLNGEWFKLTPGMISIIRTHSVIDDRFDELFAFGPDVPDANDLEIVALREEIHRLKAQIEGMHPTRNVVYDSKTTRSYRKRGWNVSYKTSK